MKCILCGGYIPDGAKAAVFRQNGLPSYYIKREVCENCAKPEKPGKKRKTARWMPIPDYAMHNAFELAGHIMKGVLRQYRNLYTDALREVSVTGEVTRRDAKKFIRFHKLLENVYYHALTLGNMDELKHDVRADVNKQYIAAGCRFAVELLVKAMCEE